MTPLRVCLLTDAFGETSETFVSAEARELQRCGVCLRVEAGDHPRSPDPAQAAGVPVDVLADDTTLIRVRALAWLVTRHPLACLCDLRARRRWAREETVAPLRYLAPAARRVRRREEQHLHAHFAAGAALNALRLHRLLGVPYSVTVHGYDLFSRRMNLAEKLQHAAFSTTGSAFTVRALRRYAGPACDRVHLIVMGVDAERFKRSTPQPAAGPVVAVGRLVEKKGFSVLVQAAALLRDDPAFGGVVIAGEGPDRAALEAQIAALDLGEVVTLAGAQPSAAVRELLETAMVVAVPSVIAADGDADSMPVIAKEALAMEVMVVASDAAGLPEVVCEPWGRLAAPGDPQALADALADVLHLGPQERARRGAAGRAYVSGELGLHAQTQRLAALISAASGRD